MPKGLEHAALSVSSLERSIAFYRDLLGLHLTRVIESDGGSRLGDIVGLAGCRARIAHLVSDGGMLELFEYLEPRGRPIDREQNGLGFTHIGFATANIHGDYARLSGQGVRFIHAPIEFRPGAWVAYFRGPDGETCELRQT